MDPDLRDGDGATERAHASGRGLRPDGLADRREAFPHEPADPVDDEKMPAELQALKQEAERRLAEWATTGCGLVSSSLYEACAWFSTGLGDHHSHDDHGHHRK